VITVEGNVIIQKIVLVIQDIPELIVNSQCVTERDIMTPLFAIAVVHVHLLMLALALMLVGVDQIVKHRAVTPNLHQIQLFAVEKEIVPL